MITSPQNKQIKEAQRLRRKRRRNQSGLMLIEGQRLIQDAFRAGVAPQAVFHTLDFENKNEATTELVHSLRATSECHPCTQQVIDALADTVTPQGIVAVIAQPTLPLPDSPTLSLILDQVRDPGNVGTLLRSAEAAGVEQVLVAPDTADPFNEKVMRAAMGAHFRLPIRICETSDELWTSIDYEDKEDHEDKDRGDNDRSSGAIYLADAHGELTYEDVDWIKPSTLIVGGEAAGASPTSVDIATSIAIPMHGNTESLNAGVAGSIILFEAARQRRRAANAQKF